VQVLNIAFQEIWPRSLEGLSPVAQQDGRELKVYWLVQHAGMKVS
jgi:hypothetical protein